MPYDRQGFIRGAEGCQEAIRLIVPAWYRGLPTWREEFAYGFDLYQNARQGMLGMMVLGDRTIRTDRDLLANLGATSVTLANVARNAIRGQSRALRSTRGAVLNESYWWPFFNDCWVLGGIHGGMEFHLGRAGWPNDDELWDEDEGRPTMLGRELHILSLAGYEYEDAGVLGQVFRCADVDAAEAFGLENIYEFDIEDDRDAFIGRLIQHFGP